MLALTLLEGGSAAFFDRLPVSAVQYLVGNAGQGGPVYELLESKYPEAVVTMTDALIQNVALGIGPRQTAKAMIEGLQISLDYALLVARTEQLRVYREASRAQYDSSEATRGYKRFASKSGNTCAVCLALDGEVYKTSELMSVHPHDRCTMIPLVKGVPDPEWESGEDWLKKQDPEMQEQILGKKATELWNNGDIELMDLVNKYEHPIWGPSLGRTPLKDLGVDLGDLPGGGPSPDSIKFVPAENKAELIKRMRLVVDDYDVQIWDELSLDVQNSLLKGLEELHDPTQPNLAYIKYKTKRSRSWGRAVKWEDGTRGIELQKTFLRNPSKVMTKEIANSLALHEQDIKIITERLALPHLSDARRVFYEEKLLRLQNNPVRYLVCESADDPVFAVIAHEMWHIKDFDSGMEYRKTFESLFTPETNELLWGVSEYSMSAKKEAFAEIGSAYSSGVDIPEAVLNIFLEVIGAK